MCIRHKNILLPGLGLLLASILHLAASDEKSFSENLEYTRAVIAKNHLIALVEIAPLDQKKATSFSYDRYPELEQFKMKDGPTYARKKGNPWLQSDDWAETGTPIKPEKLKELDSLISFVDAPLISHSVSKDKAQGGLVTEIIKREATENGEHLIYEIHRERSTNFFYPQFIFNRYGNDPDNHALLIGYAGLMYSGEEKLKVSITYNCMILVSTENTKAESASSLPVPDGEKIYNFEELERNKFVLKGKVVRLEITPKVLESKGVSDSQYRLMVKDTATPQPSYGLVDFPKEGLQKLGLLDQSAKTNLTFYILVTFRSKNESAKFTALGSHFIKDVNGTGTYAW
ncbi:MAG: hypothetical protein ABIP97_09795 [Chthoniobacterales bacterium]